MKICFLKKITVLAACLVSAVLCACTCGADSVENGFVSESSVSATGAPETPAPTEPTTPAPTKPETPAPTEPTTPTTSAPTEPAPTEPETPAPDTLDSRAWKYISSMTLEEKIAGLFFVTAGDSKSMADSYGSAGGIIYFADSIKTGEQLSQMLEDARKHSKFPVFLGVDEEGGRVARVAQSLDEVENTGDAAALGSLDSPDAVYQAYSKIGTYLSRYGFDVDFAPVADIYDKKNNMFEKRSFGTDAKKVSDCVYQAVRGLQDNGVSACAKHFPGHGGTVGDSHNGAAVSNLTEEELFSAEFIPFESAVSAGTDFVMIGHISLPNVLSDYTPATLSPYIVTEILRKKIGYDGIVITDAMRMSAVSGGYTSSEAAVKAILAGCDMILMPDNFETAYQGVLDAVKRGEISEERIEESLLRIYRVKCKKNNLCGIY